MWILIEDGRLVNMDLITDIVPNHKDKTVQLFCAGVSIADSGIVYEKVFVDNILPVK